MSLLDQLKNRMERFKKDTKVWKTLDAVAFKNNQCIKMIQNIFFTVYKIVWSQFLPFRQYMLLSVKTSRFPVRDQVIYPKWRSICQLLSLFINCWRVCNTRGLYFSIQLDFLGKKELDIPMLPSHLLHAGSFRWVVFGAALAMTLSARGVAPTLIAPSKAVLDRSIWFICLPCQSIFSLRHRSIPNAQVRVRQWVGR